MIDVLVGAGFPVRTCCKVLGVSSQGYYRYRRRPMSRTMMRREWLTAVIREIHADSRGTYGSRRVHAELTLGRGISVSCRTVTVLMHNAGIAGLPGPAKVKRIKGTPTTSSIGSSPDPSSTSSGSPTSPSTRPARASSTAAA